MLDAHIVLTNPFEALNPPSPVAKLHSITTLVTNRDTSLATLGYAIPRVAHLMC
jgi:hypothetical protein